MTTTAPADLPTLPERHNVSTLLDDQLAAGRGEHLAIRCEDQRVTYAQLHARVCAFAQALTAVGVRREQRVLLVLDDTPAFPVAFLGAIRAGVVPVAVNPLFAAAEHRWFVEDSDAVLAVTDAPAAPALRAALEGLPTRVVAAGGPAEGCLDLDGLLGEHAGPVDPAPTHRDEPAFWLYSSGSTGKPKGVVHLQHDIPYTIATYGREVLRLRPDDVTLSTTKLFHAYGLGNGLSFPYAVGATTVLLPGRPRPDRVLDAVEGERPDVLFSVPTLYNAMLHVPGAPDRDLSSVRLGVSAAESLPADVWRRWHDGYGITILDGIGSTEMLHIYCSNTLEELRPGSSGKAVPGYEIEVRDLEGRPVERGETGTMYVSGDSALAWYHHNHEKTKETLQGRWLVTGDRYRQDDDGFYWYEGRADDMIKVGGLWVSPVEVENTLIEHDAVQECAVVGHPVDGLTRIRAHVVLAQGAQGDAALVAELQQWCKERLRRYQFPHIVTFVADLPKTMTGKIQRFKLRGGDGDGTGSG